MTNNPMLLRLDEDHYWISISDSDQMLFYKSVAAAPKLDVKVHEPGVSPLSIQGPNADELAAQLCGNKVCTLRFFRHMHLDVNGNRMILARSGFSNQRGFEQFFKETTGGDVLWKKFWEAGRDLDVRARIPHQSERFEFGLLSFLSNITPDMTPCEAGLGKFCRMDSNVGCLGRDSLTAKQHPTRMLCLIEIEGDALPPQTGFWPAIADGARVGRVSSACRAFSFDCNNAIGLIDASHLNAGAELAVQTPAGPRDALVKEKFWGRYE